MNKVKAIETRIIRKAAQSLIEAGYWLQAHDGEELSGERTRDVGAFLAECFATDVTNLYVYADGENSPAQGWVQFIHGNGVDVISDNTVNLNPALRAAEQLAERLN